MKTQSFRIAVLLVFLLAAFAFTVSQTAGIKATVIPSDATGSVWAVSGMDTSRASFSNGTLSILNMKAGTYKLVISADNPYKEVIKENVVVHNGATTDLGQIILEK